MTSDTNGLWSNNYDGGGRGIDGGGSDDEGDDDDGDDAELKILLDSWKFSEI